MTAEAGRRPGLSSRVECHIDLDIRGPLLTTFIKAYDVVIHNVSQPPSADVFARD